jgi:hypothetical protein
MPRPLKKAKMSIELLQDEESLERPEFQKNKKQSEPLDNLIYVGSSFPDFNSPRSRQLKNENVSISIELLAPADASEPKFREDGMPELQLRSPRV